MKITLTGTFVWKDGTGAIKANVSGANEEVYTLKNSSIGKATITDITSACGVTLEAVDTTSGIFTIHVEWNPTTINVDELYVVIRDASDTANVHLQALMPRVTKDHLVIRLR